MVLMSGKTHSAESGGPIDKVGAHIEAHHDRPLPLAELGRLVHLSPFTVQRLFKQALGVSPLQYQRALRAASLYRSSPTFPFHTLPLGHISSQTRPQAGCPILSAFCAERVGDQQKRL